MAEAYPGDYLKPDWAAWVQWDHPPVTYRSIVADRSKVPSYGGFYAFGLDPNALRPGRVLYIGKTEDKGGFRKRFGFYLKQDPTLKSSRKHKAALFLQDHRLFMDATAAGTEGAYLKGLKQTKDEKYHLLELDKLDLGAVYVWFAPFETGDTEWVRLTETAMMQYYEAWYNSTGMKAKTPYDTLAVSAGAH